MKIFLIVTISLLLSLVSRGQADSGFTNKAEAKNITVNGLKEGKWIEYSQNRNDWDFGTKKRHWRFYRLVIYKEGDPVGLVREYYRSGKTAGTLHYLAGELRFFGLGKEYYENGKLYRETMYRNKAIIRNVYDKDSALSLTDTLESDKHTGVINIYNPAGKLLATWIFTLDLLKGGTINMPKIETTLHDITTISSKGYYEDGKLESESSRVNENTTVAKTYYESGKLKSETIYTNGVKGTVKNYDENGNEVK